MSQALGSQLRLVRSSLSARRALQSFSHLMNLGRWCLVASLLLNGALAAVVVLRSRNTPSPSVESAAPAFRPNGPGSAASASPAATVMNVPQVPWEHFDTTDLKLLAARLRHAGLSRQVVAAIVQLKVRAAFDAKRVALAQSLPQYPYWRDAPGRSRDIEFSAGMKTIAREEADVLSATLGDDGVDLSPWEDLERSRRYGDVSRQTARQIQRIDEDYQDLLAQARSQLLRTPLPEFRERLALLESERRKDLAAILSPEQLDAYEMRTSSTTARIRGSTAALDLSEDQFTAIYRLQRAFDDQYNPSNTSFVGTRPDVSPEQRAAEAKLSADIKAAIGPELGARYEQMRSPEYFTTQAVVSRLGLPATNVPQVIAVQQDIEQRAAQLRTVPATTFADRQRQLAALAAEANQRLSPLLGGDRGIETYKKNGGYWLQNLTPVVVPTPSPSTPTTPPR